MRTVTLVSGSDATPIFSAEGIFPMYMPFGWQGKPPILGWWVTEGSLGGYSVERDISKRATTEAGFILHPCPDVWQPGEEKRLVWKIFSHTGEEDFFHKAGTLRPFVRVEASSYVLFPGEECVLRVTAFLCGGKNYGGWGGVFSGRRVAFCL